MSHTPSEQFPRIRMFGSVGWVASGIFSVIALHVMHLSAFDDTNLPMYCGAAVCFVAALLNLRLPHTPPSVDKSAGISVMHIDVYKRQILRSMELREKTDVCKDISI